MEVDFYKVGMERVSRSNAELREAYREQIELLRVAVDVFDAGKHVTARNIATHLRVLLLEPTKKNSRSVPLLRHIGVPPRFLSQSFSINPAHLSILQGPGPGRGEAVPVCGLVNFRIHSGGATFFAPLDEVSEKVTSWVPFPDWWVMPVLRDARGRVFARLDLVKHVADTDGGAHVDAALDPAYADVKSGLSLGWAIEKDGVKSYVRHLELHCLRQIAHEFLATAVKHTPWALSEPYERPRAPVGLPDGITIGEFMAVRKSAGFTLDGEDMKVLADG